MKTRFNIFIYIISICLLSSCGKEIIHTGEAILDGTTVRYLANEKELTLKITAEGSSLLSPIYVNAIINNDEQPIIIWRLDTITILPFQETYNMGDSYYYSLFLEKDGTSIGIGQFFL